MKKTSQPANRDRGGRQGLTVCSSEEEEGSIQRQTEEADTFAAQEAKEEHVGGADEFCLRLSR